jgi:hypothetical protein
MAIIKKHHLQAIAAKLTEFAQTSVNKDKPIPVWVSLRETQVMPTGQVDENGAAVYRNEIRYRCYPLTGDIVQMDNGSIVCEVSHDNQRIALETEET